MSTQLAAFALRSSLICALLCSASFCPAEEKAADPVKRGEAKPEPVVDEAAARKAFDADFDLALAALKENDWAKVREKLTSAMKSLGAVGDIRKSTARILLNKADAIENKKAAMKSAEELARNKKWGEAEEAYIKALEACGEVEAVRKRVLECRSNLESENPPLKKAGDLLRAKKFKEALDAFTNVPEALKTLRFVREGITAANQGIESEMLFQKASEFLAVRRWDDAFNTYKRLSQIVGNTEEVQLGIAEAQAGFSEDRKLAPLAPKR